MTGTTVTNDLTPWYKYRRPSIPERRDRLLSWYATEELDLNDASSVRSLPRGIPDALSFENIRYNRRKSVSNFYSAHGKKPPPMNKRYFFTNRRILTQREIL